MDIEYLLALQDLRASLPDAVTTLFALLSEVGEGPVLVAVVLVVYWCFNKRAGQFAFAAFCSSNFASQLLKNIVCAYRPWIRDAAIQPPESVLEGAGGYSFPSGHVSGTTSSLGALGWMARKKHIGITVACVIVILLMMFSRNFLGVHTPQDVIAGCLIAIIMIALTQVFFNWIDRYDAMMPGHNKDIIVTVAIWVLCIASIAFITLKAYPADYVNGMLVVDPVEMQKGSFEGAGVFMGFSLAWLLERRFVGFATECLDNRRRIIRFVIGVAIVGITYVVANVVFKAVLPYNVAKLTAMFLVAFMAVFVAPLAFDTLEKRQES